MRALEAIYIARGLTSGLLKIGRTWNVPSRLRALARTAEPVELLATVAAPPSFERELHRRFAAALEPSRGREWFRDDGAIRAFLATLPEAQRGSCVFAPGPKRKVRRRTDAEREASRRAATERYYAHVASVARSHGHAPTLPLRDCPKCLAHWEAHLARSRKSEATRAARRAASALLYPLHHRATGARETA